MIPVLTLRDIAQGLQEVTEEGPVILRSGGILLGGRMEGYNLLQSLRNNRKDRGSNAVLSLETRVEFLVDVIKRLELPHVHVTLCMVYNSRKKNS